MSARDLPSVEDLKILGLGPPDFYQRFIAAFDEHAALEFCLKHGGFKVFVPNEITTQSKLAQRVGEKVARWIQREFSVGWVQVPIWIRSESVMRRYQLRDMIRSGHKDADICERLKVHQRTVSRVRIYMRQRHLVNFPPAEGEAAR